MLAIETKRKIIDKFRNDESIVNLAGLFGTIITCIKNMFIKNFIRLKM